MPSLLSLDVGQFLSYLAIAQAYMRPRIQISAPSNLHMSKTGDSSHARGPSLVCACDYKHNTTNPRTLLAMHSDDQSFSLLDLHVVSRLKLEEPS